MKCILFITGLIFLVQFPVNAQDKTKLVGTWYGKIRTYQFKQDGNAQCYTKRKIAGYEQQLIIDKKLNYTYTEYYRGDTMRTNGHVDLSNDTLKFLVIKSNQSELHSVFESSYFLYLLNNSELIYSNFPIKKIVKEEDTEDKIFTEVEVEAEYKLGNNRFLKILYASFATQVVSKKDSVRINSFKVKIDSLGNMDATTLETIHADTGYFSAIKQGLLNLPSNFKPAMQNGRPVAAFMSFKITY